jgi:hypothetical protein
MFRQNPNIMLFSRLNAEGNPATSLSFQLACHQELYSSNRAEAGPTGEPLNQIFKSFLLILHDYSVFRKY